MKVLYLVSGIGPPAGWGTEFIQNLIFELSKKGVNATIINPIYIHTHPDWENWTKDIKAKYGIKIISIQAPMWIKKRLMLHFLLTPFIVTYQVIKLLSHEKFDLVHEFSSTPIILFRALLIKILFQTPTVFTLSVYNNTFLGNFLWFKLFNFAKIYLIPSQEIINVLITMGIDKSKIIYLPPGIDFKKFFEKPDYNAAKEKLNLPKNKFIVSYFGPLTTEKGVRDLIEAAEELNKENLSEILIVLFTIWKGSSEHTMIKDLIKKLNFTHLKLVEKYVDIPTALSASDAVILPQHTGFGTTIPPISTLEAIASHRPVIATNIIGNREIIKSENGILIPPKSPTSIVSAIIQLYKNPIHPKANLEISKIFSLEKITHEHLTHYQKIISS